MSEPTTLPVLTEKELASQGSYLTAYFAASEVLQREQTYWAGVAHGLAGTQPVRDLAASAAAGLGQQILLLDSLHVAIMDRYYKGLKPPSPAMVKKAVQLTAALAKDIQAQVVASKVLDVVTTFVTGWAKL